MLHKTYLNISDRIFIEFFRSYFYTTTCRVFLNQTVKLLGSYKILIDRNFIVHKNYQIKIDLCFKLFLVNAKIIQRTFIFKYSKKKKLASVQMGIKSTITAAGVRYL